MICTFDLTNKMICNLGQHYRRLKGRAWGETEENMEKESIAEAGAGRKTAFLVYFKSLHPCFALLRRPSKTVPPLIPEDTARLHWLPASPVGSGMPAILLLIVGPRALLITSSPSCGALSQYYFSLAVKTRRKASGDLSKWSGFISVCVWGGVSSLATLICVSTGLTGSLRENSPQISGSL